MGSKLLLLIRCCLIMLLTLVSFGCGSKGSIGLPPDVGGDDYSSEMAMVATKADAFLNAYLKGELQTVDSHFSGSVKWTVTEIDSNSLKTKKTYTHSIADIQEEYLDYLVGLQQTKLDNPNFNMTLQWAKTTSVSSGVITVIGPVDVTVSGIQNGPVTKQTPILMKFVGSQTTWRISEIDWGELIIEETSENDIPPSDPPKPQIPNGILFVSSRNGNDEIYVMNEDGSNQTRLTNNNVVDSYPSWSPDKTKIAFASRRDGPMEIYIMDADGSNVYRLTNSGGSKTSPAWSPDGSKVLFTDNPSSGYGDIYVISVNGTKLTKLTSNPYSDGGGSWSPDGSKIVYGACMGATGTSAKFNIYTMNADGSGVTRLTNNTDDHSGEADWSPDGTKILFTTGSQIYVMNTDGSNVTGIGNSDMTSSPTWSPDGQKIAYFYAGEIYVMDSHGGNMVNITMNQARDEMPDW